MTDKNYTHLLAIVDRSGSMSSCQSDMRGGLDELFKSQAKVEGKCLVDYVQFDTEYELVFEDTDVSEAKAVLTPRGATALLDAVGKAVTDLGEKLAKLDEDARPGLVQVVVVTDGYENASRDWRADGIKKLINDQEEKYKWDFVFLGANMDAVAVGASFGFKSDKSLTYDTSNIGAMSFAAGEYVTRSRVAANSGGSSLDNAFTSNEREDQKV